MVTDRYGGSPSLHKVLRHENVERRTRTLGLPEAAQLLDFTDKQRTVDVMRFRLPLLHAIGCLPLEQPLNSVLWLCAPFSLCFSVGAG